MIILSLSHNIHDSSAVVADDYNILAAMQTERITRNKGDGQFAHVPTIHAALQVAGVKMSDVQVVLMTHGLGSAERFRWWFGKTLCYQILCAIGKKHIKHPPHHKNPNTDAFIRYIGAPENSDFYIGIHHYAHALSALFFTDWPDALLYTADGGGDATNYSVYHFDGDTISELYGESDKKWVRYKHFPADSIGLAYGGITQALGYKICRHEGKLTGLAAYGEPVLLEEMKKYFWVDETGRICTPFSRSHQIYHWAHNLAQKTEPKHAAASVQQLLEDIILESINVYLQRTKARHVGLAGGVFANVTLNRKIMQLPGVSEGFIFPAMGDEGLAIGAVAAYLLERDGLQSWKQKRRRLKHVYWGGSFDKEVPKVFANTRQVCNSESVAKTAAELIAGNKIVALYVGRMEFGPRALGARSILAAANNREINDTLNKRLSRTEFMPFAPVVLAEDACQVFEVGDAARYAMRFMTITCVVREEWRQKIPAVVHIDNTARPQIIEDVDNPLYAAILREYKARTGLPVLINTSFNAHEEPIIYTPQECLDALNTGRVDFVCTKSGVFAKN